MIGIDPHRGSHAAAVLDAAERVRRWCSCPLTFLPATAALGPTSFARPDTTT